MLRTVWPRVRAILIVAHVIAILLAALPAVEGGMNRSLWNEPTARAEFVVWAERFGTSVERIQDTLWTIAVAWMDFRAAYMKPIRPYLDATGALQSWRMFVGANRYPTRFQVQVRDADAAPDEWRTLYFRDDPAFRWRAGLFEQERLRNGLDRMSWPHYRSRFEELCTWIAAQAFAEFPRVADTRCRMWRARSPSPEEARAGTRSDGTWLPEVLRSRPGAAP